MHLKHLWYHKKRYDIIHDKRDDIKFWFHMILSLFMISYMFLWYHHDIQYHLHHDDFMHDFAVWYYVTEFRILQMISYTKSLANYIVCTFNFYEIIKKCMISYMLNMICHSVISYDIYQPQNIYDMIVLTMISYAIPSESYPWYHTSTYDIASAYDILWYQTWRNKLWYHKLENLWLMISIRSEVSFRSDMHRAF